MGRGIIGESVVREVVLGDLKRFSARTENGRLLFQQTPLLISSIELQKKTRQTEEDKAGEEKEITATERANSWLLHGRNKFGGSDPIFLLSGVSSSRL